MQHPTDPVDPVPAPVNPVLEHQIATSLPAYECHKTVRAARVKSVRFNNGKTHGLVTGLELELLDGTTFDKKITSDWAHRHRPFAGGYLVVYDNGYESFSPPQPFEAGYTLIEESASEPEELTPPPPLGDPEVTSQRLGDPVEADDEVSSED